jgi:hypothetical protein
MSPPKPRPICLVVALALALVVCSQAAARTTLYGSRSAPRLQRWIDESAVPTPSVRVRLHGRDCPIVGGTCMFRSPAAIWVQRTPRELERLELMHEVGHFFSDLYFTAADRAAFERLDRKPGAAWNPGGKDRPGSPHEDFGNAYAWCSMGVRPDPRVGVPVPPNLRAACGLIRRVAGSLAARRLGQMVLPASPQPSSGGPAGD